MQSPAFMILGITLTWAYGHAADGIVAGTLAAGLARAFVAAVPSMHHVCAATEAHHEIEEPGEKQKRNKSIHKPSLSAPAVRMFVLLRSGARGRQDRGGENSAFHGARLRLSYVWDREPLLPHGSCRVLRAGAQVTVSTGTGE